MLSELCELEEIQKSGKKAELVERLMEEGIRYEQLQNKYLKEMCDRSGLDCSGAKAELIARLTAGQAGNKVLPCWRLGLFSHLCAESANVPAIAADRPVVTATLCKECHSSLEATT
jgi:hypothetical protein